MNLKMTIAFLSYATINFRNIDGCGCSPLNFRYHLHHNKADQLLIEYLIDSLLSIQVKC